MSYAQGRVINDADSHIMESLDWLPSYADPKIRDGLISMRLEAGGSGAAKAIERALPPPPDEAATAGIAVHVVEGAQGWAGHGAMNPSERAQALGDLGLSRGLV